MSLRQQSHLDLNLPTYLEISCFISYQVETVIPQMQDSLGQVDSRASLVQWQSSIIKGMNVKQTHPNSCCSSVRRGSRCPGPQSSVAHMHPHPDCQMQSPTAMQRVSEPMLSHSNIPAHQELALNTRETVKLPPKVSYRVRVGITVQLEKRDEYLVGNIKEGEQVALLNQVCNLLPLLLGGVDSGGVVGTACRCAKHLMRTESKKIPGTLKDLPYC